MRKRWWMYAVPGALIIAVGAWFILWRPPGFELKLLPPGSMIHYESSVEGTQKTYTWKGDFKEIAEQARRELIAEGFIEIPPKDPNKAAIFAKKPYFISVVAGRCEFQPFGMRDPLLPGISGGYIPEKGTVSVKIGRHGADALGARIYALRHGRF